MTKQLILLLFASSCLIISGCAGNKTVPKSAGLSPPQLLQPENGATEDLPAVFIWQPPFVPTTSVLTYTLIISTDRSFKGDDFYKSERLIKPYHLVPGKYKFKDGVPYYWKVRVFERIPQKHKKKPKDKKKPEEMDSETYSVQYLAVQADGTQTITGTIFQMQEANVTLIALNNASLVRTDGPSFSVEKTYPLPPPPAVAEGYLIVIRTNMGDEVKLLAAADLLESVPETIVLGSEPVEVSFLLPLAMESVTAEVNMGFPLHTLHTGAPVDDVIPVVIKGSATPPFAFDKVDMDTVRFGPEAAPDRDGTPEIDDFDNDGHDDLKFQFLMSETGLDGCTNVETRLLGETDQGVMFESTSLSDADCQAGCHEVPE
jgi:hypothetical protein